MNDHEYALIGGVNRSWVGRAIFSLASLIAASGVTAALGLIKLAQFFPWAADIPPALLSVIAAGLLYLILYASFDRFAWRWLSPVLGVPDLSGTWACKGKTLDQDGKGSTEWNAEVVIVQSWDKVRVRLKTPQSGSNSINAALMHDSVDGYKLIYNYRNDPRPDQPAMRTHLGFAELTFSKDLSSAEGTYFNGHGRCTFGQMHLSRT